jgi:sugar diacid utilization regulator
VRATAGAMVRRLLTEPDLRVQSARREAARVGIELADSYWPAVLGWRNPSPAPDVLESTERMARDGHPGVLVEMLGPRMVLLHPDDGPGAGWKSVEWQRAVAEHAHRTAPSARPQAIAAERPARVEELAAVVSELTALWRLGVRPLDDAYFLSARRFALESLLAPTAASPAAAAFVQRQLGSLVAWDREHHGDLLSVLETALDFPRHDRAAARCFMHRNTFRRRLQQATEILGDDLEDPDARLAVHVALKLRRVLEAQAASASPCKPQARSQLQSRSRVPRPTSWNRQRSSQLQRGTKPSGSSSGQGSSPST